MALLWLLLLKMRMRQVTIALVGDLIQPLQPLNHIALKLFIILYFNVLAVNGKPDGISRILRVNRTRSRIPWNLLNMLTEQVVCASAFLGSASSFVSADIFSPSQSLLLEPGCAWHDKQLLREEQRRRRGCLFSADCTM